MLVLSEFAGAANYMPDALQVNPHDIDGLARTMYEAITLPERGNRSPACAGCAGRVRNRDVFDWARSSLQALERFTPAQ